MRVNVLTGRLIRYGKGCIFSKFRSVTPTAKNIDLSILISRCYLGLGQRFIYVFMYVLFDECKLKRNVSKLREEYENGWGKQFNLLRFKQLSYF